MRLFQRKKRLLSETVYGMTDVGMKRDGNEDAFLLLPDKRVYIVSDGMGGHNAGEAASLTAVKALESYYASLAISTINAEEIKETMINAVLEANKEVLTLSRTNPEYSGMGCTVVTVFIEGNNLHACHIGDSRVYVINKEKIVQVTNDHSVVTELIQAGTMTKEEARRSHLKNELTQALGTSSFVRPEYNLRQVRKGDIVLLCTDGLWDMLSEEEIHQAVNEGGSPEKICSGLIQKANDAGGADNITVVVIKISGK